MNCIICDEPCHLDMRRNTIHYLDDHRFFSNGKFIAIASLELFDSIYMPQDISFMNDNSSWTNYITFNHECLSIKINDAHKFIITKEEPIFYWKNLKELSEYIKKRLVFE